MLYINCYYIMKAASCQEIAMKNKNPSQTNVCNGFLFYVRDGRLNPYQSSTAAFLEKMAWITAGSNLG